MPGIVAQIVGNYGKRVWNGCLESAGRVSAILTSYTISPILIYEQDADGESRFVYYGETANFRMLS